MAISAAGPTTPGNSACLKCWELADVVSGTNTTLARNAFTFAFLGDLFGSHFSIIVEHDAQRKMWPRVLDDYDLRFCRCGNLVSAMFLMRRMGYQQRQHGVYFLRQLLQSMNVDAAEWGCGYVQL